MKILLIVLSLAILTSCCCGDIKDTNLKSTVMDSGVANAAGISDSDMKALNELIVPIYFDYNKYDIKPESKKTLKSLADSMSSHQKVTLIVEGHCDERGTNEYNLALGDKRANATMDYLLSIGVPKDRISSFSYGEEKLVCKENTESCWSKNRRAQFVVSAGGTK